MPEFASATMLVAALPSSCQQSVQGQRSSKFVSSTDRVFSPSLQGGAFEDRLANRSWCRTREFSLERQWTYWCVLVVVVGSWVCRRCSRIVTSEMTERIVLSFPFVDSSSISVVRRSRRTRSYSGSWSYCGSGKTQSALLEEGNHLA